MKFYRIPTKQEEQLIELLVHKSSLEMSEDWKNDLLVCPMDDGEMGSLYLFPQGKINERGTEKTESSMVTNISLPPIKSIKPWGSWNTDQE